MQNHGLGRLVQQFKLKLRRYRGGWPPPHHGNSFVVCSLPKVRPAECDTVVAGLVILARMTQVAGFTHTNPYDKDKSVICAPVFFLRSHCITIEFQSLEFSK